jgi:hypothetical protein
MTRKSPWLRRLGCALLAAALACGSGCLCCLHPLEPVCKEHRQLCGSVPECCRNHVYLFFLQGNDPFDCANLAGLRDRLIDLGYLKCYLGPWYYAPHFAKELGRLHKDDPTNRFVLIGLGHGAEEACRLARKVEADGVAIDLVVYLGGGVREEHGHPGNVGQVCCVQPADCPPVEGAVNLTYPQGGPTCAATHPQAVELLLKALAQVACKVPVIEKVLPPNPNPPLPLPHPVTPPAAGPRDQWDFLKPEPLPNLPAPGAAPGEDGKKK